jgi:hypothetical protein
MVILTHGGAQSLRSLCWLAREHDHAQVEFRIGTKLAATAGVGVVTSIILNQQLIHG